MERTSPVGTRFAQSVDSPLVKEDRDAPVPDIHRDRGGGLEVGQSAHRVFGSSRHDASR